MTEKLLSPLVKTFDMLPHPEGGWYKELWKASFEIPKDVLDPKYSGSRPSATSIYFLLHPEESSAWHRVYSDELWLWHSGSPLELLLGGDGEQPGGETKIILGMDVEKGQVPQALVPANVWQAAKPLGDEPVFVSCVVSPGFHFDDFTMISGK
ncbi:cupin domain-containing protein [Paenibacillus cellulositrophicus]|jgi:predicted cupin superfamily sugar epimerase|uniref:Cupin superfamily sugar epimerase n=1 Tax=Paenibacillus favisporus TaxID=221028 RepID=A0ABV2EWY6_9BACL|nr:MULTISPECIES: cupin domain-containing protein [Paenibacillus]MBJ9988015.1 cupin domain-containing protein [Paenibacillus sp. S28]MCM2999805.1 cupin domain-containing protein [Paenibacillus cellulositrophicus]MEC0176116.1 cupin domain-containing protein [Paenibacillus favisporus]